ncbi:MAG: patatin-like phospholipase family protein [Epulopiscium sp.]|nr:patatin-like phospholipase family protein [Candidatus Epulonipiscium sp.]
MKADVVFEGGGVKGIGMVGAVCYLEEKGYVWQSIAGTSAGSIIAALLATGYQGHELKKILLDLSYTSFMDKTRLQSIPLIGKGLGIVCEKGLYAGDEIEIWMEKLLEVTGKTKFKDVSINGKSKLKIIATDITNREMLTLPDDLIKYGIDPMSFQISKAVRMSCSIPLYFKPYKLVSRGKVSYIVDGGVTSNFPVWIFDTKEVPRWPTIGFKMIEPPSHTSLGKTDIISFVLDIVGTVIEQNETKCMKDSDSVRTIGIPSAGIKTTDFNISQERSLELFRVGYEKAEEFYKTWCFEKYVEAFRSR